MDAGVLGYANDVESACANFVGWCAAQDPRPASLSVYSLPGLPWQHSDWDPWAWYDDLMAELSQRDRPPVLVDLSNLLITHGRKVLWPEGGEFPVDRRLRSSDSPYPIAWFGSELGDFRRGRSTYNCYPPDELPPLKPQFNGTFAWLEADETTDESIAGDTTDTEAALSKLLADERLELPAQFVRFFRTPKLWRRIKSCTGCYLHLDDAAIAVRGGHGRLIRFLSDSQDCLQSVTKNDVFRLRLNCV